ncbi:MAG TPA: PCRF domain-containing protein, partial [Burkholderiales bacterium]|nr:PCRF domain-containing protein [Burkholderiales bacterium]
MCGTTRAGPPWKSTSSSGSSKTSASASARFGGFFEYDRKLERLEEVARELEDPQVWSDPARAQDLGRERARLTGDVGEIDRTTRGIAESVELLELAEAEGDEGAAREVERDAQRLEGEVRHLELKRMFRGEMDSHSAF